MTSKTILITGATNGIGKQAAHELAKLGAHLLIVGRDAARTQAVRDALVAAHPQTTVETYLADLSRMAEVKRLADAVKAKHSRIDVLVNNAGAIFDARHVTVDGYEQTFALNHLAYFLLVRELIGVLSASAPARIVNVASAAHSGAKINFDDLHGARGYSSFKAYGQSKLANIMFSYALARRVPSANITVNALHPGFVDTGFGSNGGSIMRIAIGVMKRFGALTPEKGADTLVYLASSPEVEGVTGKYWDQRKAISSNAASMDDAAQERLWEVSERLVNSALALQSKP